MAISQIYDWFTRLQNFQCCQGNVVRVTSVCLLCCRCVSCIQCGATSPGLRCEWQKNYTQCAPCASLATCPICLVDYSEGTTILQCRQCDRCAAILQNLPAILCLLLNLTDP